MSSLPMLALALSLAAQEWALLFNPLEEEVAGEEGRAGDGSCRSCCQLEWPGAMMLSLSLGLLWAGVLCVCCRQLHQTSTLAVAVMEESYREALECTEEDITDKVRAALACSLGWPGCSCTAPRVGAEEASTSRGCRMSQVAEVSCGAGSGERGGSGCWVRLQLLRSSHGVGQCMWEM